MYQSLSLNVTENAITNSVVIEPNGKRITTPVNTNGNMSANGWMGLGKKIKKLDLDLGLNMNFFYSRFNDIINYKINNSENGSASIGVNIRKMKDKVYEFSISNDFGYNVNNSTAYNRKVKYNTNTVSLNGAYYIKKTWKISSDYEYNYRQKTDDFSSNVNNNLWNGQLEKSFHKDEFTAFFRVRDILNQNIGIDRNINGNTLTEIRNDRLQRYWMLGFRWDFKNKTAAAK